MGLEGQGVVWEYRLKYHLKEPLNQKLPKEQSDRGLHCLPFYTLPPLQVLTLKALNKNCSRRHFNFLLSSFKENKT